jgi:voltage-gated potassium channel Kch
VIVCGLHGVGLRIVELLHSSSVPTVVIDDDPGPRLARTLIGWGIPHIVGALPRADHLAAQGPPDQVDGPRAVSTSLRPSLR